nr:putative reverse transcriptase domain, ribonuclease H-like domain, aspartic peptidase domain protein [Tanacetum cinerariifolium]
MTLASQAGQSCAETCGTAGYDPPQMIVIVRTAGRMRELVIKYKAEKVCHEEMVKMPLVDLKVLEDGSFRICMDYRKICDIAIRNRYHQMRVHEEEIPKTDFRMRYGHFEFMVMPFGLHEVKRGARVAFEDEFRAAEEREVLCEAQQGRSGAKRKLFGSFRNKIVVDAWRRKGGVKARQVQDICRTIQAEISEKMLVTNGQSERIFWTLENMFRFCVRNLVVVGILTFREMSFPTKMVVIKERLKEAKDRQERVKLIVGNQNFRI